MGACWPQIPQFCEAAARAPEGTRRARKLARAGGWVEEVEGGVNGWWVGGGGEKRAPKCDGNKAVHRAQT